MSVCTAEGIASALGTKVLSIKERKIGSLWAGYGTVSRLTAQLEDGTTQQLVIKKVSPRPASGVGHNRKIKSYHVEACFYNEYAPDAIRDAQLRIPHPLAISASPDSNKFEFVLSDLSPQYPDSGRGFDLEETKVALTWLAQFHAYFWERDCSGLWDDGCFWHLETRLEELKDTSSQWRALKDVAHQIDAKLKGEPHSSSSGETAKHRTIVHGDFKAANIVFSADGTSCAAYDFQYVGGGFGTKDVAYLLCSSVDSDVVEHHEEEVLKFYHELLLSSYAALRPGSTLQYSYEEMTRHFGLSLLDFVRFMAGWGWWGNTDWSERKARQLLKNVKSLL